MRNHALYWLCLCEMVIVSAYLCALSVCLQREVAIQMFTFEVCPCRHFPQRATNYSEPLFSHTQPLQSVNASPLTSQGCCLCTVLLCHRRLVPLGLCTLIPLSFLGASPVFSQGSFLCEPAQPLSLSGCHSPSLHTPNTMALKCENLKTKGPLASFEACCKTSKSPRT